MRSVEQSEIVVKKRNASGCLIVRKKIGDGVDGVGASSGFRSEKKRPRPVSSGSESSEEPFLPGGRRVSLETMRACQNSSVYGRGTLKESESDRKRSYKPIEGGSICRKNGEEQRERQRYGQLARGSDEYGWFNGSESEYAGRRFSGSKYVAESSGERGHESRSSKRILADDQTGSFSGRDLVPKNRFEKRRDDPPIHMPSVGDKFMGSSNEVIRIQGKNGVLKVMVNKRNKMARSLNHYGQHQVVERKKIPVDVGKRNVPVQPPLYSEAKLSSEKCSSVGADEPLYPPKSQPTRGQNSSDSEADDSDLSLTLGSMNAVAHNSKKTLSIDGNPPSSEKVLPPKTKEDNVRRGSGTEKQKLREHIRKMLVAAGWKIDYRPRKNRDYLDVVYVNPAGTAYWSILKAYDALQKQLKKDNSHKHGGDGSSFTPISNELLSQLTRRTRKKIEKEMEKQRDVDQSDHEKDLQQEL